MQMWTASVLTIFPDMFPGPLGASLAGRALEAGIWSLETVDIRDFTSDRHRSIDDTPAGGGPGMVMRADVLGAAIDATRDASDTRPAFCLSPRGRPLTQALVRELAEAPGVLLLCGRFEGIDERVIEGRNLEELSIGGLRAFGRRTGRHGTDRCGGAALAGRHGRRCLRHRGKLRGGPPRVPALYPPPGLEGRAIPDVLTSGNHARIAAWRRSEAERITRERRPDLWAKHSKSE